MLLKQCVCNGNPKRKGTVILAHTFLTFLALRESVRLFFYIVHPCQTDTLHPPDRRTLPIQLDIPLSLGHHDTHSYRVITLLLHSLTVSNEYSTSSLAFYFFAVDLFSIYEELRVPYALL